MPNRDKQVIGYVDDAEYAQLKEWSNETGKSMSQLVREAILEYVDRDRTARIEDKLDRLLEAQGLSQQAEHAHTRSGSQKSVPEKARTIARRIYNNHEAPVQGKDVEIAIEDIAGGDDRTIEKYKDQLKKRNLLFRHPLQPVWTDSKDEWVGWVENATVGEDVHDRLDEYGMDSDEYAEIAERVIA